MTRGSGRLQVRNIISRGLDEKLESVHNDDEISVLIYPASPNEQEEFQKKVEFQIYSPGNLSGYPLEFTYRELGSISSDKITAKLQAYICNQGYDAASIYTAWENLFIAASLRNKEIRYLATDPYLSLICENESRRVMHHK
jgi:hypothetical protein